MARMKKQQKHSPHQQRQPLEVQWNEFELQQQMEGPDDQQQQQQQPPAPPQVPPGYVSETVMKEAIQKARSEEKQKQFDEINRLKGEIQTANDKAAQLDREKSDLNAKIEALNESLKDGKVDPEQLLAKYTEKVTKNSEKNHSEQLGKLQRQLDDLTNTNRTLAAERLRDRLIKENGGEDAMVVELVSGEEEDAILSSIEKAKSAYTRIVGGKGSEEEEEEEEESSAPRKTQKNNTRTQTPPELPTAGGNGGERGGKGKGGLEKVKTMSSKEYAEGGRDAVMSDLRKRYPSGAKPFSGSGAQRGNSARR